MYELLYDDSVTYDIMLLDSGLTRHCPTAGSTEFLHYTSTNTKDIDFNPVSKILGICVDA